MSLFWRIFLLNAAVLVAVGALLLLGPITISTPVLLTEAMILTGGIAFMLAANAALLRLGLFPLQRVTRAMTTTDLLRPSPRPEVAGHGEIAALIETFNTMLDRLEAERATSSARALSAQEAERRRVAQELHDEVGQTLTAVLLELKRVADHAPEPLRGELRQVQEITRGSLDEIRRIARRLRPGVLEELGLVSALTALITETPTPDGLTIRRLMGKDLPELGAEAELVVYRIAQEALTNTVRHARATRLELAAAQPRRSGAAHPRRRPRPRGRPGGGGPARYARTRSADRGRGLPRSGSAGRHRSTARCARPERKQVTMPTSPSIATPSRGATAPTRILLADDHALVRRGVRLILDGEPDLTVVAEALRRCRGHRDGPRRTARPGHPGYRDASPDRPPGGARAVPGDARSADPDAHDVRQRAVLLRGVEGGGGRVRPQVGRGPGPGGGLSGGDARRAVPLPGRGDRPHP